MPVGLIYWKEGLAVAGLVFMFLRAASMDFVPCLDVALFSGIFGLGREPILLVLCSPGAWLYCAAGFGNLRYKKGLTLHAALL